MRSKTKTQWRKGRYNLITSPYKNQACTIFIFRRSWDVNQWGCINRGLLWFRVENGLVRRSDCSCSTLDDSESNWVPTTWFEREANWQTLTRKRVDENTWEFPKQPSSSLVGLVAYGCDRGLSPWNTWVPELDRKSDRFTGLGKGWDRCSLGFSRSRISKRIG